MTSTRTLRLLAMVSIAPFASAQTLSQTPQGDYYYGGLGIGAARGKLDAADITRERAGVDAISFKRDDHDNSYRLFGGYQINRYLGVEAGYFHLGHFGFNAQTTPAGTVVGRTSVQGLNLDLVGTMPMTDRLSAMARVGAQYARTRSTLSGTGAAAGLQGQPSSRHSDYKVGAGLQYAVNPSFLVRGDVERYRVSDALSHKLNINTLSLSLVFPFGQVEAAAPRATAPAYVAPAPAPVVAQTPPPAAVMAPPPPVVVPLRRVSFSAESLYGFDQSTLQAEGRRALDDFARELQGTTFTTITVEGHTDRLGSPDYNQKLSQDRADAVKAYLVTSGQVNPEKISAVGRGESSPTAATSACKGTTASSALIACLQPDRRVDIEVAGTR